jgi:hypothetical protein
MGPILNSSWATVENWERQKNSGFSKITIWLPYKQHNTLRRQSRLLMRVV